MKFYKFALSVVRFFIRIVFLFRAKGTENIPQNGAFLLCANHRAYRDPVFLAAGCNRQLTFMAKDSLFTKPILGKLIKAFGAFPIRRGKGDAAAVMTTIKILRRGGATLIFPEGKRIKNGSRIHINPGIIRLAVQCRVPIVPAYVGKSYVVYGKPIDYNDVSINLQDAYEMQNIADSLMETIYSLGAKKCAEEK